MVFYARHLSQVFLYTALFVRILPFDRRIFVKRIVFHVKRVPLDRLSPHVHPRSHTTYRQYNNSGSYTVFHGGPQRSMTYSFTLLCSSPPTPSTFSGVMSSTLACTTVPGKQRFENWTRRHEKHVPFRDRHQLRSKVLQPRREQNPWPNEVGCFLVTTGYAMLYPRVEVHLPTRSPVLRRGFVVTPSGGCKRSEMNPVEPVVAAR